MYSLGPQSEGNTITHVCCSDLAEVSWLVESSCAAWQVTTWEEKATGPEASTSTLLCPSDQAGEASATSSELTSSSMQETFAT